MLGERALEWIERHEAELVGADDPALVLKYNGELAAIAALLADRGDARGAALLARCWARLEHGRRLQREVAKAPALATMYPPFWRHGLRDDGFELAAVAAAASAGDATLRLLIACALHACDLASPWQLDDLLAASCLGRMPPTWKVTLRDVYVAAHVVLFCAPRGQLADDHVRYVLRSAPVWIADLARGGELDLLGELVMTVHALGACVPPCEWQVLVDAQDCDGMIPFRLAWRGRDVAPLVRLRGNYHSTLVAIGASAMCRH